MIEKMDQTTEYIYVVLMKVTLPGIILPYLISSIYKYFILELGEQSFELACPVLYGLYYGVSRVLAENRFKRIPLYFSLPFNWKTPFGYAIANIIGYLGGFLGHCTVAAITIFTASSFWMLRLIIIDATNDLPILNTIINLLEDKTNKLIKNHFYKIAQGFFDAKKLSR